MIDLVGESLGPYTITERIGRGGMADVYKAVHNSLAVHRALKIILPELVISEDFRSRFQKEAQSVASLRHQNIVQVHDFGAQNSIYYMVMEFIEGQDLKRLLKSEGRIRPIARAVTLIDQVASALEYAHARGLIHRDIKPENIMITPAGQPILTDFGIAKLVTAETRLTQTGASIGTPAYMAPEQALGSNSICPATDIYALTVVLYELLTGQVPFTADTPIGVVIKTLNDPLPKPQTLCPDIGDELQGVVLKGTAKEIDDRYDTVANFRAALTAALKADATGASTHGRTTMIFPRTLERAPVESKRNKPAVMAGAAVAAVAVVGGAFYWNAARQSVPPATNPSVETVAIAQSAPPTMAPQTSAAPMDAPAQDSASTQTVAAEPAASLPLPVATPQPKPIAPEAKSKAAASTKHKPAELQPVAESPPEASPVAAPASQPPASQLVAQTSSPSGSNPGTAQTATQTPTQMPAPTTTPTGAAAAAASPASSSGDLSEVQKGVTTQRDLIKLFGGPNLTTYDDVGREVWVYERTATQTESRSSAKSSEVSASLGLFFKSIDAGASGSKQKFSGSASSGSAIRSITVMVTFAPNRTVYDYTVKSTYF